jgi:hypothetical protein
VIQSYTKTTQTNPTRTLLYQSHWKHLKQNRRTSYKLQEKISCITSDAFLQLTDWSLSGKFLSKQTSYISQCFFVVAVICEEDLPQSQRLVLGCNLQNLQCFIITTMYLYKTWILHTRYSQREFQIVKIPKQFTVSDC